MKHSMPARQIRKSERDLGLILIILALLLIAAAVIFHKKNEGRKSHSSVAPHAYHPPVDDRIDEALKKADAKRRFEQRRIGLENEASAPVGSPAYSPNVHVLQLRQQKDAQEIIEQLSPREEASMSPEERIRRKRERDDWVVDYDERYKDEFVRQFQENARKHGYNVRVNENLDVTGVTTAPVEKPIRVPQSLPGGTSR